MDPHLRGARAQRYDERREPHVVSRNAAAGLTKVTVSSSRRRVDIALPNHSVLAEMMPLLLRHVGEDLADEGQTHGGWELRRADGQVIDQARSIGVQDLRDGEVLYLKPGREEWPELDYDDVVDAIATGARKQSRTWNSRSTRRAGVGIACGALVVSLALVLSLGAPWLQPGGYALGLAVVVLVGAIVLSRAIADSPAGVSLGIVAMLAGFAGGLAILNGDDPLTQAEPPQYLVAFTALLLVSLAAYVGVADQTQYFVAGMVVGILGLIGSATCLSHTVGPTDAAAILLAAVVALTPAMPLLAIRLGKLPMPSLPSTAADLLADPPPVSRQRVYATVRRSDELLTGLLLGSMVVAVVSQGLLVVGATTSGLIMVAVVALASVLRTRLFPATRHRAALLITGVAGLGALAVALLGTPSTFRLAVGVPLLVVAAAVSVAAGLAYQNRPPSPYFGRIADILDVLLVLAVVPMACVVTGLYSYFRGLYG